jgi:hypothetical protein
LAYHQVQIASRFNAQPDANPTLKVANDHEGCGVAFEVMKVDPVRVHIYS